MTAYFVCKKWRLDFNKIFNFSILFLIGGVFGGRLFWWLEHLGEVRSFVDFIYIRNGGLSSLGGFALAGMILFLVLRSLGAGGWRYHDVLAIAFIPTWIFSRLGCFLIHDHPGRLSNFFLAINFPAGARFDAAFLEIILMILIGVLFLIIGFKKNVIPAKVYDPWVRPNRAGIHDSHSEFISGSEQIPKQVRNDKMKAGSFALFLILIYSFSRFFLDFLRATDLPNSDPRYLGLTLAQYGMIMFFAGGLIFLSRYVKLK